MKQIFGFMSGVFLGLGIEFGISAFIGGSVIFFLASLDCILHETN